MHKVAFLTEMKLLYSENQWPPLEGVKDCSNPESSLGRLAFKHGLRISYTFWEALEEREHDRQKRRQTDTDSPSLSEVKISPKFLRYALRGKVKTTFIGY